jgi:phosphoribosyl-AMP cyclohydrolase
VTATIVARRRERRERRRLDGILRSRYAEERFLWRRAGALMCALVNSPTGVPAFDAADGLVTAVVQDAGSGEVLMVAPMNREAWDEMLASGRAVYFSRARGRLWWKGEESGNIQLVREIYVDCDADAVLLKVEQKGGAACHEGYKSCFFRQVTPEGVKIVGERVFDPAQVYGRSE